MAQRLLVEWGSFPRSGQSVGYYGLPPGERVLVNALLIHHLRRKEAEAWGA